MPPTQETPDRTNVAQAAFGPAHGSAVSVIRLFPHESECCVCGRLIYGSTKGIAMYEGCAVPHDSTGDWAGFDACDECFDKHERGELPTWPHPPNGLRETPRDKQPT